MGNRQTAHLSTLELLTKNSAWNFDDIIRMDCPDKHFTFTVDNYQPTCRRYNENYESNFIQSANESIRHSAYAYPILAADKKAYLTDVRNKRHSNKCKSSKFRAVKGQTQRFAT